MPGGVSLEPALDRLSAAVGGARLDSVRSEEVAAEETPIATLLPGIPSL